MSGAHIHPSILSADFSRLADELERIKNADGVHVDVMDQHFVPNLTLGLPVVQRIAEVSPVPVDVHLMIEDADYWALEYAQTGAQSITFHAEAAKAPIRLARQLKREGVKASMALRPSTPLEPYLPLFEELDMLLVMTVEPGFGGQPFLESMLPKIALAAEFAQQSGVIVQVDGGISSSTIQEAARAGAINFVAGSAVYGADSPQEAIEELRRLADEVRA